MTLQPAHAVAYAAAMRHDGDGTGDGTVRLTVRDAADVMGISAEAVRKRMKRGTVPTERDPDGTVRVLLDGDGTRPDDRPADRADVDGTRPDEQAALAAAKDQTISLLREQLEAERTANRENRRLLAAALERIPALEAPRDGHETATAGPDGKDHRPANGGAQEGGDRRSWWRRWFGFE